MDYTNKMFFNNRKNFVDHIGGRGDNKPYLKNQLDTIESYKNKTDNNDRYNAYNDFKEKRGIKDSDTYKNKTVTYVNIDSKFRNKKPYLNIDSEYKLEKDPITFYEDSNQIFIKHIGHTYTKDTRIILKNVSTKKIIIRTIVNDTNAIEFTENSEYVMIRYTHNLSLDYNTADVIVEISNILGETGSTYIQNIPINMINKKHIVYLTTPINTTAYEDRFYIKLEKEFIGTYSISKYNFYIQLMSIAGIPLNYINANYPIDINHYQGYHSINNISVDGYFVVLNKKTLQYLPSSSITGGGSHVSVAKVTNVYTGYPDPNHYSIILPQIFNKVTMIDMVSSEFPNSKKVINKNNNKIYWQNLDDGNHVYNINISEGNYEPSTLSKEIESKFYNIERVTNTNNASYTKNHYMEVKINTNTNIVSFRLFREAILTKPILSISPDIQEQATLDSFADSTTFTLTIEHKSHELKVGDKILINKAISHMGIPASIINKEHAVKEVVSVDKYKIELEKFNISSSRTSTGGGTSVYIYTPNIFRMRFDYDDTIGSELGFRDVGEENSITNYSNIIYNSDPYELDSYIDQFGNSIDITNNNINLSGDNYILMDVKNSNIKTIINNGAVKEAFAKILLADSPGKTLFNTMLSSPKYFKDPLPELNELEFCFYTPSGVLYDFAGLDHSFTLAIETMIETPENTNISSRSGRIIQ